MAIVRCFHRYRGECSFTLPQLVAIAREQLPQIAPEQPRYLVRTLPTERTIRFYTTQGLVDKPIGHEGQVALYGYRHLLQILAVKYLQSHYLPLRKVKSLMQNASNRDLEQLMPHIAPASWAHRGFTRDDRRVAPDRAPHPARGRGVTAAAGGQSGSDGPVAIGAPSPARAGATAPEGVPALASSILPGVDDATPSESDAWHRLEVGPGIELHVHAAVLSAGQREQLRGTLLRGLGVLRGWFDGNRSD